MAEAVIVSAVRVPTGKFLGTLKDFPAPALGAMVVREAVSRAGIDPAAVDECIMGNVVSAGTGQAPARQAALKGGLAEHVAALTINKVCGSGLKAEGKYGKYRLKELTADLNSALRGSLGLLEGRRRGFLEHPAFKGVEFEPGLLRSGEGAMWHAPVPPVIEVGGPMVPWESYLDTIQTILHEGGHHLTAPKSTFVGSGFGKALVEPEGLSKFIGKVPEDERPFNVMNAVRGLGPSEQRI